MRYPRDGVNTDYGSNDYLDQFSDLKLFYKKYAVEELLNRFISYTDKKNKCPIQVRDLRLQVDDINPTKNPQFEEYRGATTNGRLYMILIRHRESEMIPDGNMITQVNII